MKHKMLSILAAALAAMGILGGLTGCQTLPLPGSSVSSSLPEDTQPAASLPESAAPSSTPLSSPDADVSHTEASSADQAPAASTGTPAEWDGSLWAEPAANELNQIWLELSGTADTVLADAFAQGFTYQSFLSFEYYHSTAGAGHNAILLHDRENGTWHMVDLGEYATQDISWVYEEDPDKLCILLSGYTQYPDGSMRDFPRVLAFDPATGETAVQEYRNNATGTYGGTSWLKQKFSSAVIRGSSVELEFEALDPQDTNSYRSPQIDIQQDMDNDSRRYTIRFDHVTESLLSEEQMQQIAGMTGIGSFQDDSWDNAGFTGIVWSITLEEGYELRFSFRSDHTVREGYRSFIIEIAPTA